MEKKGSDHFRDILNPYGEKPNYGKIGRRRRLSKLNVFFSIILSVTIHISNSLLILSLVSFFWLGVWPHACYALLLFCRLRKNRRRRRLKNRRGGLPRSARNRLRATMLISWEGPVGCWSEYGFSFYKRTMVAAKDDEQQTPDQFWKHLSC